jgi:porin
MHPFTAWIALMGRSHCWKWTWIVVSLLFLRVGKADDGSNEAARWPDHLVVLPHLQTGFEKTEERGCGSVFSGVTCGDDNGGADCCLFGQPTLTGDWHGCRTSAQESGISFRGTVTQFAFGVAGGVNNPAAPAILDPGDTFKYTGRGEYDLIIDLDKSAGLSGTKLLIGAQHWWGQFGNVSFNTGSLTPVVLPAIAPPAPNDPGDLFLTDFLFTQNLSEDLIVFAGKKNILGTADQDIFAGGDGTDQFMNQALLANPAYLLALPYSSYTAGVILPQDWGMATAYVWDPRDRTTDGLSMDDLFADGVLVGVQVKVRTNCFKKPGEFHVGGIWKHVDLIDLSQAVPPPNGLPSTPVAAGVSTIGDAYTIYSGFDQYLQVFPGKRRGPLQSQLPRGWGLFGRASVSDGNPTPFEYFLSLGIGGDTRYRDNRGDAFGIGWFFNGVTDKFGPAATAAFGPQKGTGVEAYYKFQLTPWLAVTPDVQFIRPGFSNFTSGDDALVYGLRVNLLL